MSEAQHLTWIESHAFAGSFRWRIKDGHLRFDGKRGDGTPRGPLAPRPVTAQTLAAFARVLRFVEVDRWRDGYDPSDCGYGVLDGFSWRISGQIESVTFDAAGSNAFPSFEDPTSTALELGRYYLLAVTFRHVFDIEESLGFPSVVNELP